MGTYGVAAAALAYFDKPLDNLSISEVAYLAALPKAPNNYHPFRKTQRALARRNWVIDRMYENGYITQLDAMVAKQKDLGVKSTGRKTKSIDAAYYVEEIRRQAFDMYGEKQLYGCLLYTSPSPRDLYRSRMPSSA